MNKRVYTSILVFGLLFIILSVIVLIIPFTFNRSEGSIDVNWANPVGIKIDGLRKGDSLDLTYNAELNVSMYLLTRKEAEEYRSPLFYKEPLPDPIFKGRNGSLEIEIEKGGDYEILFLPEEPSTTFKLNYTIDRDIQREKQVYFLSAGGLFLTSMVLIILGIVLSKNSKMEDMHK
jgi:hypothetical protein